MIAISKPLPSIVLTRHTQCISFDFMLYDFSLTDFTVLYNNSNNEYKTA